MDNGEKRRDKSAFAGSIFSGENIVRRIEKIFDKRNKYLIAIILIIGILLMTLPGAKDTGSDEFYGSEEERLCKILSQISGCGEVSVMITYSKATKYGETSGNPIGAIIVSDGADSSEVKIKLSEAVQAALDLPPHKVRVYKSNE